MENISLSLAHTVFLPQDAAVIDSIDHILCSGNVSNIQYVDDERCFFGDVDVDVYYTAPDGSAVSQKMTFPWQQEVPSEFECFDVETLQVQSVVTSHQVLLDDAFEVMFDLHISQKEPQNAPLLSESGRDFAAKLSAALTDDLQEQMHETAAEEMLTEEVFTDEVEETDEFIEELPSQEVLAEDTAEELTETAEVFESGVDQQTEVFVEETEDKEQIGAVLAEQPPRPKTTTESVGNEYRIRFYLTPSGISQQ